MSQILSPLRWSAEYTFLDATFEDAFIVNSPNHPVFEEDPDSSRIIGEGKLQALVLRSGVYLRGDEPNLLDRTDGYAIVNLRGEYRMGSMVTFFVRIDNALDEDYETFGLLGEPDEVFPGFEDPRFLGTGAPFGAWAGVKVKLK